jgi:hypothetical protein
LGVIATVAPAQESDAAIERTRRQVKMLDDLYKTAVVLITTHYVTANSSLPAGSAAIALFDAMKEKGWHEVRLLDATGSPLMAKNVATDAFAREAIARLKAGESYYDTVAEREGKRYLRAVTPIPVVMEKCIMCHPNYAQAQQGEPIGVLAYTVPIE